MSLLMLVLPVYGYNGQDDFYSEVKVINEQHALETMCVPGVDIKAYTPDMKAFEVGFTAEELEGITEYSKFKGSASRLTYEEAEGDADIIFRVLKNCYGAYFYFGGDKTFERAKEDVLSDCKAAGEKLSVSILRESLKRNLSFVKDGHFRIGNEPVLEKAVYYSNEETVFLKDKKGYYVEEGGKRSYVSMVDGSHEIEKYMKRSINDKGMLVYKIGMLSADVIGVAEVVFDNRTEKFVLVPPKFENHTDNGTYYSDYEVNGIPVISVRSFMYEQDGRRFVRSADTVKNSKVSVLDMRGNCGGMSKYVIDWLDIYDPVLSKYATGNVYAYRISRAADYLKYKNLGQYLSDQESEQLLNNYSSGSNGWEIKEASAFVRSKNSNLLFVLVDNYTFSAGEWLIAALRNKDNVIFVGTNSGGGLMSDSSVKIVLPNSRINIECGSGLGFYYDEAVFTEETGFSPDIWVNDDAMMHTLNMISYYGL
ncbi:S41 family peptidase [Sedimentibacter sp. MB35-C1]|uniref:S41 family peptidase n=1 Tax=Sedimentibacter sp. MB35-C1 TaxID=3070995 RepID=UPI0027DF5C8D|nr:S41 family peptidase [Sedimentibacter sp. MB35-C1]WMJ78796.1 S41 family peptidase [Sedimentibacter sp. MB35-C1]